MFEMNLQLFGGGGSKSGLKDDGGPYGGMKIETDKDKNITYNFIYMDREGNRKKGIIPSKNEIYVRERLNDNNIHFLDKSLLPKNFFDRAKQISEESGEKIDWEAAQKAYEKAYKKYLVKRR